VDPLQRLHTLQNLALLLGPAGDGVPSIPRTLRDANLQASGPGCAACPCAVCAPVRFAGCWTQLLKWWLNSNALHGPHSGVRSGYIAVIIILHVKADIYQTWP